MVKSVGSVSCCLRAKPSNEARGKWINLLVGCARVTSTHYGNEIRIRGRGGTKKNRNI